MPRLEPLPEQRFLAEAEKRSAKYEWTAAVALYQKILDELGTGVDLRETARVSDLLARSHFKACFQAATRQQFKQQIQHAKELFDKTTDLYERAGSKFLADRSRARSLFASYWIIEDPTERKKLVEKSIHLVHQASTGLGSSHDRWDLAQTHLDLLDYSLEACVATEDSKVVKEQFERIAPMVNNLVNEFDGLPKEEDLVLCLSRTVSIFGYYYYLVEQSDFRPRAEELAKLVYHFSEKAGTPLAISMAKRVAGVMAFYYEENPIKALDLQRGAISAAQSTKDSYYIGFLFAEMAERTYWAAGVIEDADKKRDLLEEGIELAQSAIKNLEILQPGGYLDWAYSAWGQCHYWLAYFVETETEKKKEHYRRAIEIAQKGISYTTPSTPWVGTGDVLSKTMVFLANLETDPQKKSRLLSEALPVRERVVRTAKALAPESWNLGVYYNYLALIKAELSRLNTDPGKQIDQLREAVASMQLCVELCEKTANLNPPYLRPLGLYEEWYGDILVQLYALTRESDLAQRAIGVYEAAAEISAKYELSGPKAAARWKIARIYDSTGNYRKASESFKSASKDYWLSAKKIPTLSSAHEELASYMDAWSQIEEARLHHDEEHYPQASEKYFNAAGLLQHTKAWNHLSTHYTACSLLEKGEALSRQENPETSVEVFSNALGKFQETTHGLEEKMKQTLETLDQQELKDWLEITKGREKYSRARIELEEARLLDKKGEEEASSAKYRSAHAAFKHLLSETTREQSRRELETLMLFCEAWAKMKQAEVEASPELYSEAASSFTKARESTAKTKFRLLALANASMCKALEAGTKFRHSRDIQLYGEIKKQLETAADQYEQAGFKNAAEWTRATQAMFDALAYMASGEMELEPRKKTEFYHLSEKHLDLASKLYREAGFQTKSDEALRHLKRARQEKEILLTPAEVLAENPAVAGAVVAPVSLIRDQAAGLEKFELAQVVGNLTLKEKELGVGSDLTVELEMANVGKTAAMLIKLENLVPVGLQLDRQKILQRVEDNFIDMKGKRLEYMKTHEVKVPMKALAKGIFQIRPRVLFVDEKGAYKSYDFEPVALTVKELGISGWLKGPGSK